MEVNVLGSGKLVIVSAAGGAALLMGGLFATSAFVSAQEPSPTPAAEEQVPQDQQAPSDDGSTPRSREECDKDGSSGSSGSGSTGATGRGVDNARYF